MKNYQFLKKKNRKNEWNNINGEKGGQAMLTVYYGTPGGGKVKAADIYYAKSLHNKKY